MKLDSLLSFLGSKFSGLRAKTMAAEIAQFHCIPTSPGYDDAAPQLLANLCDGTRSIREIAAQISLDFGRVYLIGDVQRALDLPARFGYVRMPLPIDLFQVDDGQCSLDRNCSRTRVATSFGGGTFRSARMMCLLGLRPISNVARMKNLALRDEISGCAWIPQTGLSP